MTRANTSRQTTTIYFLSRPLAKTLALLLAALGLALALILGASSAHAQTPVVEAKNADEATVLQVNDDGGLLGLGAFGTGVIPAEGEGVRLMWYPAKAAFRAGRIGFFSDGAEWNDANVGAYSVAFGRNTTASGVASTAMGDRATASEFASTAMGDHTTASGWASTAMGHSTTASGNRSVAMGFQTTAQAFASLVIGRYNVIAGNPTVWSSPDFLFVAGNGSFDSPSNALTLLKNGDLTIAGDLTESSRACSPRWTPSGRCATGSRTRRVARRGRSSVSSRRRCSRSSPSWSAEGPMAT
jgi:hypothetical protein